MTKCVEYGVTANITAFQHLSTNAVARGSIPRTRIAFFFSQTKRRLYSNYEKTILKKFACKSLLNRVLYDLFKPMVVISRVLLLHVHIEIFEI